MSYLSNFQVHLVGFTHYLLLYSVFFFAVYISVSLVLIAVFNVVYVSVYPISYFLPISALGVSLLLVSKISLNFYPIVV